jgi:hypothetical protein
MKVELELSTKDEDESVVMDKISEITRYAKEQGFRVEEIEIERDDDEDEEDSEEHDKKKTEKRKSSKRKRSS